MKQLVNICFQVLGLEECADTLIGDQMRRGISGGQKKRVTIGKCGLVSNYFTVLHHIYLILVQEVNKLCMIFVMI